MQVIDEPVSAMRGISLGKPPRKEKELDLKSTKPLKINRGILSASQSIRFHEESRLERRHGKVRFVSRSLQSYLGLAGRNHVMKRRNLHTTRFKWRNAFLSGFGEPING